MVLEIYKDDHYLTQIWTEIYKIRNFATFNGTAQILSQNQYQKQHFIVHLCKLKTSSGSFKVFSSGGSQTFVGGSHHISTGNPEKTGNLTKVLNGLNLRDKKSLMR